MKVGHMTGLWNTVQGPWFLLGRTKFYGEPKQSFPFRDYRVREAQE